MCEALAFKETAGVSHPGVNFGIVTRTRRERGVVKKVRREEERGCADERGVWVCDCVCSGVADFDQIRVSVGVNGGEWE